VPIIDMIKKDKPNQLQRDHALDSLLPSANPPVLRLPNFNNVFYYK